MKTVHELSGLTGVSIRALQYYDEIGLLKPARYTEAGYRLYDEKNLERPEQIVLHFFVKDGEEKEECVGSPITVTKQDEWKWSFELSPGQLAKTEGEGEDMQIIKKEVVIEEEVPAGYAVRYEGYNIINTRVPETGVLLLTASRPAADAEQEQSFVYTVSADASAVRVAVVLEAGQAEGSVRLIVPPGAYQVAEENAWSWRWSGSAAQNVQVAGGESTAVRFDHSLTVQDWLNGYAHQETTAAPVPPAPSAPDALLPEDPEEEERKRSPV